MAAIEVCATHAVPPEKAEALAALSLPWIEVKADAALYDAEKPWTADTPLPALRRKPASDWRCDSCTRYRDERERQRREAEEKAAYRVRLRRKHKRVIDLYYPHGRHVREILWELVEKRDGEIVGVQLWRERRDKVMCEVRVRNGDLEAARRELWETFRRWVEYHEGNDALVDLVTDWIPAKKATGATAAVPYYPSRYAFDFWKGWQRKEPAPEPVTNLNDLLRRLRDRK